MSLEAGVRLAGWSWVIGGVAAFGWLSSWLPAWYHFLLHIYTVGESGMMPDDLVLLREARPWLLGIGLGLLVVASLLTVMLTGALTHVRRSRPALTPPANWSDPDRPYVSGRELLASSLALAVVGGIFAVPDPIYIPLFAVSGGITGALLAMIGGGARDMYASVLYGQPEPAVAAEHSTDADANTSS